MSTRDVLPVVKLILAAILFTAIGLAQDAPLRIETRIVDVEVVVRGGKGPVEGLTAEDFTVYDRGRRQSITAFAVKRDSDAPALRPMPLANRAYREGQAVAPTVILLDTLNSRPQDMLELRRQIGIYLQRALPNEPIAIYSLNKELTVVQDFTQDLDRLRRLLARWSAPFSSDLTPEMQFYLDLYAENAPSQIRSLVENVLREVSSMTFVRRAELTAYAFEEISNHLAGIPGRKRLIWAGGGFPAQVWEVRNDMFGGGTDVRNYSRILNGALQSLNEAQIAVYPIGVANPAVDLSRSSQLASPAYGINPSSRNTGLRESGIDTLNLVAGSTGGKAYYARTDNAGAVEDAMQDSVVTYQIAFTPSPRDLDGKYHELKVEVRRQNDQGSLDVRHRKGYLAAAAKPPTPASLREQLHEALAGPLDTTGIGLGAEPIAVAAGQPRQYLIRIDGRDLQIGSDRVARITLATSYPDHAGSSNDLDLTFATDARLRDVLANGYIGRIAVEHPDAKQLRIAVQDRATGRTGTLTIDLAKATD